MSPRHRPTGKQQPPERRTKLSSRFDMRLNRCLQGVGKTTLVMRVLETLRSSHPHLTARGFYTRTAPLDFRTPIRSPVQVAPRNFTPRRAFCLQGR